jgi:hypothetical protein
MVVVGGIEQYLKKGEVLSRFQDLVEPRVAADHGMDDCLLLEGEVILRKDGEPLFGSYGDLALIGLHLSGEELQKGGFTCPVGRR